MKKLNQILGMVVGLALLAAVGLGLAGILQNATSSRGPAAAQTPTGYPPPFIGPYNTPVGYPPPPTAPAVSPTPYPAEQPTSMLPPLLDSPDQFDPKTYGLPEVIAGYRVLAVKTSTNTACLPQLEKTLVLQTTEPNVQDSLKNFRSTDVDTAMEELGLKQAEWGLEIAGPGASRDQLITLIQETNKQLAISGCPPATGGGIRQTAMPNTTQDKQP